MLVAMVVVVHSGHGTGAVAAACMPVVDMRKVVHMKAKREAIAVRMKIKSALIAVLMKAKKQVTAALMRQSLKANAAIRVR